MCLVYSKSKTADFRRLHRKDDFIYVYKVVRRNIFLHKLYAVFQNNVVPRRWYKSDRIDKKLTHRERTSGEVHKGIHVYLLKRDAENYSMYDAYRVVLQCKAYLKDLVGVDRFYDTAVFTQVYIPDRVHADARR